MALYFTFDNNIYIIDYKYINYANTCYFKCRGRGVVEQAAPNDLKLYNDYNYYLADYK